MSTKKVLFIETPLVTPLREPPQQYWYAVWRTRWRQWRFTRRKASKLLYEEIDDVLQQSERRISA